MEDEQWISPLEELPQWTLQPDGTERVRVIATTRNGYTRLANFGRFDGWQVDGIDMDCDAVAKWRYITSPDTGPSDHIK